MLTEQRPGGTMIAMDPARAKAIKKAADRVRAANEKAERLIEEAEAGLRAEVQAAADAGDAKTAIVKASGFSRALIYRKYLEEPAS